LADQWALLEKLTSVLNLGLVEHKEKIAEGFKTDPSLLPHIFSPSLQIMINKPLLLVSGYS
jgi:hypothetical protein